VLFRSSVQYSDYALVQQALDQLSLLSNDDIAAYVKPRISDPDCRVRAMAAKTCIDKGDLSLIPKAIDIVVQGLQDEKQAQMCYIGGLQHTIEESVSPEYVPLFFNLIDSKSTSVRGFAVRSLRLSGDRAAFPYLKKALSDSDQMIRYDAMMGLAMTLKDYKHAPSIDKFKQDEATYLDYWKNYSLD
jgi:HEAT repeat protein